jgi:predicted nucleic-acid-binding Zn-ribbon protein
MEDKIESTSSVKEFEIEMRMYSTFLSCTKCSGSPIMVKMHSSEPNMQLLGIYETQQKLNRYVCPKCGNITISEKDYPIQTLKPVKPETEHKLVTRVREAAKIAAFDFLHWLDSHKQYFHTYDAWIENVNPTFVKAMFNVKQQELLKTFCESAVEYSREGNESVTVDTLRFVKFWETSQGMSLLQQIDSASE